MEQKLPIRWWHVVMMCSDAYVFGAVVAGIGSAYWLLTTISGCEGLMEKRLITCSIVWLNERQMWILMHPQYKNINSHKMDRGDWNETNAFRGMNRNSMRWHEVLNFPFNTVESDLKNLKV